VIDEPEPTQAAHSTFQFLVAQDDDAGVATFVGRSVDQLLAVLAP
jgi:hypothetical protein